LAKGRELIGNSPGVLRRLRSPRQFFDLLRECGVSHPEVRYQHPADPENWLIKAGCSEGGKRVRFCAQEQAGPEEYYQRRLPGPARSALFLADGRKARILGFNTLWTAGNAERPYLFGGAINRTLLSPPQREQIRIHVARLVEALALRGLNSLDFMVEGDTCRVLEINGRPSATLALYDADFPEGLVAAHIKACRGQIEASRDSGSSVRAFRVFFASETLRIPKHRVWPSWCADRPVAGSVVYAGHQLCTTEAEGRSTAEVLAMIEQRETRLIQNIPKAGAQHTQ
jgi:predicted ATP-grasp superfamily ATP-dependent carboligase